MKRALILWGITLSLSGCANLCDCQPQQAKSTPATETGTYTTPAADRAVATDGTVLDVPVFREAMPVGDSPSGPDQLAQVAADPTARPFLPVATAPKRLVRQLLPSEFPAAGGGAFSLSQYPQLPHSHKELTDYARQLAFQLSSFESLRGAKVGVTTFVEFDHSLDRATPLGNQFAEALVSTLPVFGVTVVEFKKTRAIKITARGDFSLSRDVRQLSEQVGMDYVLVGTLVSTRRGIQVHSRVVSVRDAGVVASATTLLPHLVLQQIQP